MVFFGEPRGHKHAHDAGVFMKIALVPLALGTLTTWLLAGEFGRFLGLAEAPDTAGLHAAPESTLAILTKVATAPATALALLVVAAGLLAWWRRDKLSGVTRALRALGTAASNSFGFEAINRGIVNATSNIAESLRVTQTGVLNWNVLAILVGLVVVMTILALGGA